jgi:hypothetical protein
MVAQDPINAFEAAAERPCRNAPAKICHLGSVPLTDYQATRGKKALAIDHPIVQGP